MNEQPAMRMTPAAASAARWGRVLVPVVVAAALLCLSVANIAALWRWTEREDGVLWAARADGVVAVEVAPATAGARAGLRRGDLLLAVDGQPIDSVTQIVDRFHSAAPDAALEYTVLRMGSQALHRLSLSPVPTTNRTLYFVLAAVAMFALGVGVWVRLRRPRDPATLHFFWLSVAFFGVLAFSFSGRLDRLDWFFYWADAVALLMLPPLFTHFALVFPVRTDWATTRFRPLLLPLLYLPAALFGALRVRAVTADALSGPRVSGLLGALESLELVYLGVCVAGGMTMMIRALRRVRSVTARRQLRWIVWGTVLGAVPFAVGYLVPFVLGFEPGPQAQMTAIPLGLVPLAFASAVVRYRLMDVEVIFKRALVYTAAIAAILVIYAVLQRLASEVFLGGSQQHNSIIALLATLVVVLLASPVKNAIQSALDRAYYRDRYDYRRALVAFARDLNRDLDLQRLSDRLVTRIMETLVVDRMALVLTTENPAERTLRAIRAVGFEAAIPIPRLPEPLRTHLAASRPVALDDVLAGPLDEAVEPWRRLGVHYLVPCVSTDGIIAVMALGRKESGEPLSSEDMELLAAVAGQVATALENGRLYGQLRSKASELDRLREFSENVIDSLNDGLAVVDLDERIIRWNRGLEQLYGVGRAHAIGQRLDALFDEPFVALLREATRDAAGDAVRYRVPLQSRHTSEGRALLVNAATVALRTPDAGVAGTIVLIEDISSRAQLEEQLQISEKMASIGLLAAGVAHEVNTPLTGISSFTQMLLDGADPSDPKTALLEKIERQTFRAAKIVNGLLNLARPARAEMGPVDLHAVIGDVLSLLEHQLTTGNVTVRRELVSGPLVVEGMEYKLQQVLLNLFLNARDAMPSGGWLTIATRTREGQAVVEVSDTGSGISREHLSRIYDPFFTTKGLGKGTGLGLSITYGIVQEHGGTVACDSAPGKGTTFTLELPLVGAALVSSSTRAAH